MRWEFGSEPLAQTVTLARSLRDLLEVALALEHDDDDVDELIATLTRARCRLAERVPPEPAPRVGRAADGNGRVYLDHAFDIGAYNPCFPEYRLAVDGDRATGTVTFPIAYEGPPGIVHGGFLAVFFDCVIQHHNCELGLAGKTSALSLRYRRPTPLLSELRFELVRRVDDRRITSTATLSALDGEVLCSAEMAAVAGDRAALPEVSPRRIRR